MSDRKVWTLDTFQEFLYQQSRHELNKLKYFATVHKIPRSLSIIGEGTFYEWFKSIFTMRDEDIEDSYGEDALQYLRFQRYVIGYLMFVMVICISVVLPLNFMGGLQGSKQDFDSKKLVNHSNKSKIAVSSRVFFFLLLCDRKTK